MPFSVKLPSEQLQVEPGTTTAFSIDLTNTGTATESFELGVSGVDPEWIAVPVPSVSLDAGETQSLKVFFNPPRTSLSAAGNYPFIVGVRSLLTGDQRTHQAVLTIKPFHHLSVELTPRRGSVSASKRQNVFSFALMNMGNTEHLLALSGDDPEDACTYEFDEEQVRVGPGQQREIDVAVNPIKMSPFGASRLIGFTVTARSTAGRGVASTAQAQLEVRPFLSPATAIVTSVLGLLGLVLWQSQPKPPTVSLAVIGPKKVFVGDKIPIRWTSENATSVLITAGGLPVDSGLSPEGTLSIPANLLGTLRIQAVAKRDRRDSAPSTVEVEVEERPYVAPPSIEKLEPSKEVVNVGESFVLKYKFGKTVVKAKIAPLNQLLDLNLDSIMITPTDPVTEYTVLAENSEGVMTKQSFKVRTQVPVLTKILRFSADPLTIIDEGDVTLTWQTTEAAKVELSYPGSGSSIPLASSGSSRVEVRSTTKFVLTATDINGRTVSRTLNVVVRKAKPPTVPDTPSPADPRLRDDDSIGGTGTAPTGPAASPETTGTTGRAPTRP